jgi:serine/threonine protein kinase
VILGAAESAPELAKYELLERIGVGGMATVYRARDRRLGREVAVKLIHTHLRENKEVAARFVSEARAVARLRHPNLVEVFDISDENEPERYLVVELVRGITLRSLLSKHRSFPPEISAAIGIEIAAALGHAHSQGIIHRDVKPENVLIDLTATASAPSGTSDRVAPPKVKLTDFGIAKLLDAQGVTSTGQVLGSPAHMAPEQIEGGDVGARADVFALGVLLYECMVGRLPFDGKNPAQVLRRVLDGTYPPADRELPSVGAIWAEVLSRALAREAADRYASVEEFAAALRAELERLGITDSRHEIERLLSDQDGYRTAYEDRLVTALVSSGEKARAARDFRTATVQFNRALAYRPGDADLLRRVSHMARRDRLTGILRKSSLALLGIVTVAGVVAFSRQLKSPLAKPAAPAAAPPVAAPPKVVEATAAPKGQPVTEAPAQTQPPALRRPPTLRSAPPKPAAAESATRKVVVDVIGPKGGYLKIDGVREDTWFGVQHELTVGSHVFEFVPGSDECCKPSLPVTRVLTPGTDVEEVRLAVAFREARLRVDRSPPGVLRCRSLFSGDLAVPGARAIPMSRLSVAGSCTLTPEDSASTPLTKEVTLGAGQTTEVSWP